MTNLALIPNIGHQELLIILVIALILFGRRLPEVGRSLGRGIVEFKKGIKGIEDDIEDESDHKKAKKPAARAPIAAGGDDPRVASTPHAAESTPESQA